MPGTPAETKIMFEAIPTFFFISMYIDKAKYMTNVYLHVELVKSGRQAGRQAGKQAHTHTGRQARTHTRRQAGRHTRTHAGSQPTSHRILKI